jgi:hypothetical protein
LDGAFVLTGRFKNTVELFSQVGPLDDQVEDAFGFGLSFRTFVERVVAVEAENVG